MWKQVFELLRSTLLLSQEVQYLRNELRQNNEEIKAIRRELREVVERLNRLDWEFERWRDNEKYEREKLVLQLQNTLLQFEHRLPPTKDRHDS